MTNKWEASYHWKGSRQDCSDPRVCQREGGEVGQGGQAGGWEGGDGGAGGEVEVLGEGGHPGQTQPWPPCTATDCPVPARARRWAGGGQGGHRRHHQEHEELPLVDHVLVNGFTFSWSFPHLTDNWQLRQASFKHVTFSPPWVALQLIFLKLQSTLFSTDKWEGAETIANNPDI